MRMIQLVAALRYGDAIGNEVMAFHKLFSEMGYRSEIYSPDIDPRVEGENIFRADEFKGADPDDKVIYHVGSESIFFDAYCSLKCKKAIRYHNITPPEFFKDYNIISSMNCERGYTQVEAMSDKTDYAIAVSGYNKKDLERMGYKCKIDVLPILMRFSDYETEPDKDIIKQYGDDGYTNILFVGRVAPNKKFEDIIAAFDVYNRCFNEKSRLILVGGASDNDHYKYRLNKYIDRLGQKNIFFTGHISFAAILAYYKTADVFLCMSEHEGFCVPLVESMFFDVPVIAYDAAAIGDTLGGAGVLLDKKDPALTAGVIDRLVNDKDLKDKIIKEQRERLKDFDNKKIGDDLIKMIQDNLLD